jgi:hypothetical protein
MGSNAAECRKPDQPDRPTRLTLCPAGADREARDRPNGNAIRGAAVVGEVSRTGTVEFWA